MRLIKWTEIYERLKNAPPGKLWGVPRGGSIIAGLTGRAVDHWSEADWIVDDVIDTGKTKKECKVFEKPFWALIDKQEEDIKDWLQFPWEYNDESKRQPNRKSGDK